MAATDYPLLDQLQAEVNRVLEQTGRIFAAGNKQPDVPPVAQVIRLKSLLPESLDRFHHALDQLEDELQMAKLVMRRDLAVCRELAGLAPPQQPLVDATADDSAKTAAGDTGDQETSQKIKNDEEPAAGDVPMADAEPEAASNPEANADQQASTQDPVKDEKLALEQSDDPTVESVKPEDDSKAADTALQIDTKPPPLAPTATADPARDEEKQPDTGTFSNTADLESLFGAPTSAGPDFNLDNDAPDFDFASFGNDVNASTDDNDNLSALLPGLQDYANNQAGGSGEPDFDALFSTDIPSVGGQDGDSGERDTTFDDLMNFADFGTGDFTGGGDGSGNNADQDFDFSFD